MNQLFENYCAIPAGRYCTGADIENFCGADIENIHCAIPGPGRGAAVGLI